MFDEERAAIYALNSEFYSIVDFSWSLAEQTLLDYYADQLAQYYLINPGYRDS